ncbi:CHAT domain-containing protein [Actinoplanes sp. M2I2]|uniref:CHAT domain-containing protein n=1 Tax=Actinoplanes sp. M2I2 TaxID=1734444 RepID=UPI002021360C|nr:CHAT domain-containing protein [Actinoplanes sp. M2I2]
MSVVTAKIVVSVSGDGTVVARRDDGVSQEGGLRFDTIDTEVVRVFARWLARRTDGWLRDEVQAFGALLHRTLFPREVWSFVDATAAGLGAAEMMRLQLSFPARHPLAALPWEYLYVPPGPGLVQNTFLATHDRVLLSRAIPGIGGPVVRPEPALRVLVAVAQPDDQDDVVAEPVLTALDKLAGHDRLDITVLPENATPAVLSRGVQQVRPHLVHFIGHGFYDERDEVGTVALVEVDGSSKMVTAGELAELCSHDGAPPRMALLESCHGATNEARGTFSGTAPQLVLAGTRLVVAMQYAITPESAAAFSTEFYAGIAVGAPVDAAVQRGRRLIASALTTDNDPRLLGVPLVYLQNNYGALTTGGDER